MMQLTPQELAHEERMEAVYAKAGKVIGFVTWACFALATWEVVCGRM